MDRQAVTEWESGLPETPCGRGSMFENTEIIRAWLPEIIDKNDIWSIADVGCGDQNWVHRCLPDGIEYDGFDIMPRRVDVVPLDVTRTVLPTGYDLVMTIFVLNHLEPSHASLAVRLLQESGSRYWLTTYSDGDAYEHSARLVDSIAFCDTGRHVWRYGVFEL